MPHPSIRVAIGGGNAIERAGLAALLNSYPGIDVVLLDHHEPPNVFVWDAGSDLSRLPNFLPDLFLLVLVDKVEVASFPPGVMGLISKDESPEALGVAIRQVARGQQYLSPSLAFSILRQQSQRDAPTIVDLKILTEREREILDLLSKGLSNKAIAARLYLSVRTVEGHLNKLYARLGVRSRTEAVIFAMQHFQNE